MQKLPTLGRRLRSKSRRLTGGWLIGVALGAAAVLFAAPSHAVGVNVEVSEEAETMVDARLARRLIRLELADVELPHVPGAVPSGRLGAAARGSDEIVFVRLLRQGEFLVVELWAQGTFSGERHLTIAANEQHQARRVALASAELARRLRETRVVERQRVLRQHLVSNQEPQAPLYVTKLNTGISVGLSAARWVGAKATLVGPEAQMWGISEYGVGLGVAVSSLTSANSGLVRSWTELALRPQWQLSPARDWLLGVASSLGAGLVDITPDASFRGSRESHQTWATNVGLDLLVGWRPSPRLGLLLEPKGGLMTRTLSVVEGEQTLQVGGPWVGVTIGARVYL